MRGGVANTYSSAARSPLPAPNYSLLPTKASVYGTAGTSGGGGWASAKPYSAIYPTGYGAMPDGSADYDGSSLRAQYEY
jgi:hypothetical protein